MPTATVDRSDPAYAGQAVYTRGFLVEFAKHLRIDPSLVQKTYLRRMREELAAAPSSTSPRHADSS